MATRVKTVEYAFAQDTANVNSGVARDMSNLLLYIPETTGRVFRSVILEFHFQQNDTTSPNMTAVLIGVQLDLVARDDATVTSTLTNSGENYGLTVTRDVTAYFAANFTGTFPTLNVRLTVTGPATNNVSCKVIITYEWDDSANTRVKTVKIPIEGNTGALTTSLAAVGGSANNVPALNSFLPESGKVYRDIFFEIDVNEATGSAVVTNPQLELSLDAEGGAADGPHEDALISARYYFRIWKRTDMVTSGTHTLNARTTNTSMPFPCLNAVLVVTYEYDHGASSTIMNSIQIPVLDEAGWLGGSTTGDKSRFQRDIFVEEPTVITLAQSGVMLTGNDAGAVTVDLRMGGQGSRTFAFGATVRCGCMPYSRRVDGGAAGGAGMTLARGKNTFTLDAFRTGTTAGTLMSNSSGILYLNYTSGKSGQSGGDANHVHTTVWNVLGYSAQAVLTTVAAASVQTPNIPETNYRLTGMGYKVISFIGGTASADAWWSVHGEVQPSEADGAGWREFYIAQYASDSEIGVSLSYARARDDYRRYPRDPQSSRLDVELARDYRFAGSPIMFMMGYALVTYSSIFFTIAGNVTGYTGDGSGISVSAYRTDNGELIDTVTTAIGGSYSMVWYDNTINVFTEAQQDATHVGRSANGLAA